MCRRSWRIGSTASRTPGRTGGHPSQDRRMGDLDATLCHHLDQVSVRQPIGDVPAHAQLDDVGIEYTFAVHWVTRDRLRHSEPPAKDPAVYPMPLDAPEPGKLGDLTISLTPPWSLSRLRIGRRQLTPSRSLRPSKVCGPPSY